MYKLLVPTYEDRSSPSSTLFLKAPVLKDTLFKTLNSEIVYRQDPENHTLFSGTHLFRPNKGVSPESVKRTG